MLIPEIRNPGEKEPFTVNGADGAFQVPFKTSEMTSAAGPLTAACSPAALRGAGLCCQPALLGHSCCPALSPGQEWLQCCGAGMSCFGGFVLGEQLT